MTTAGKLERRQQKDRARSLTLKHGPPSRGDLGLAQEAISRSNWEARKEQGQAGLPGAGRGGYHKSPLDYQRRPKHPERADLYAGMAQPLMTRPDYGTKVAYGPIIDLGPRGLQELSRGDEIEVQYDNRGSSRDEWGPDVHSYKVISVRGKEIEAFDLKEREAVTIDLNQDRVLSIGYPEHMITRRGASSAGDRDMLLATDTFAEALKDGKFEKGKPADPTKDMSPEDAAEWKRQTEEHKDNFKAAAGRPIHEIAKEIRDDWKKVYFGAVPYLDAMRSLGDISDNYGDDPASNIINYFLSNASAWRGPVAKKIKAELNAMVKSSRRAMLTFADYEADLRNAKFEEGKPADPTKHMSPEDAAEWEKQNEEHKDNFKSASERTAISMMERMQLLSAFQVLSMGTMNAYGIPRKDALKAVRSLVGIELPDDAKPPTKKSLDEYLEWAESSKTASEQVSRYLISCDDYTAGPDKESKFEKGKSMTPEQVSKVVGPEFAENVENPPDAVKKLQDEMSKSAEWKGWDEDMPVQVVSEGGTEVFENLAAAKKKHPELDPKKQTKKFTWATRGEVKGKPAIRFEDWGTYRDISRDASTKADTDKISASLRYEDIKPGTVLVQIGKSGDGYEVFRRWEDSRGRVNLETENRNTGFKIFVEGKDDLRSWTKMASSSKTSDSDKEAKLMSRQVSILKKYVDEAGSSAAFEYGDLPQIVQGDLARVKDQETLEMDVNRWLGDNNKTAAAGLYGFTKAAEKACGSAATRLAKFGAKLAKDIYSKSAETPAFLEEHAKRTGSRAAKMLRKAMSDIGPGQPGKTAARGDKGRYGFPAKTAKLALEACHSLEHEAGVIACDLDSRMSTKHATITGYLGTHSKKAKCGWSEMIMEAYPPAPAPIIASDEGAKKTASGLDGYSVHPSVEELLMWNGSGATREATSFLASEEDEESDEDSPKC